MGTWFESQFGMTASMLKENLSAINDFFNRETATTSEAKKVKQEFAEWYNGLSWWDKTDINADETFTKARNFRDRFNLTNKVVTPEQLKERQQSGVTYERAMGLPEKARTEGGLIAEAKEPLIPTKYKWIALLFAGLATLVFANAAPKALGSYLATKKS